MLREFKNLKFNINYEGCGIKSVDEERMLF